MEQRSRVSFKPRCVACGWPRCSGFISFGNVIHEPHCASCLDDWEREMRKSAGRFVLTPPHYRAWQIQRGKRAA